MGDVYGRENTVGRNCTDNDLRQNPFSWAGRAGMGAWPFPGKGPNKGKGYVMRLIDHISHSKRVRVKLGAILGCEPKCADIRRRIRELRGEKRRRNGYFRLRWKNCSFHEQLLRDRWVAAGPVVSWLYLDKAAQDRIRVKRSRSFALTWDGQAPHEKRTFSDDGKSRRLWTVVGIGWLLAQEWSPPIPAMRVLCKLQPYRHQRRKQNHVWYTPSGEVW